MKTSPVAKFLILCFEIWVIARLCHWILEVLFCVYHLGLPG